MSAVLQASQLPRWQLNLTSKADTVITGIRTQRFEGFAVVTDCSKLHKSAHTGYDLAKAIGHLDQALKQLCQACDSNLTQLLPMPALTLERHAVALT